MTTSLIVVGRGRNWPWIFLLGLCVMTGWSILRRPGIVDNLERAVPHPVLVAWALFLIVGGGVTGVGASLRPGSGAALLTERAGALILAGACTAYPVALILSRGADALGRAGTILVFAAVVIARVVSITRTVHRLTRAHAGRGARL